MSKYGPSLSRHYIIWSTFMSKYGPSLSRVYYVFFNPLITIDLTHSDVS